MSVFSDETPPSARPMTGGMGSMEDRVAPWLIGYIPNKFGFWVWFIPWFIMVLSRIGLVVLSCC